MANQWVRNAESSTNPRPSLCSTLDLTRFIPCNSTEERELEQATLQRSPGPWREWANLRNSICCSGEDFQLCWSWLLEIIEDCIARGLSCQDLRELRSLWNTWVALPGIVGLPLVTPQPGQLQDVAWPFPGVSSPIKAAIGWGDPQPKGLRGNHRYLWHQSTANPSFQGVCSASSLTGCSAVLQQLPLENSKSPPNVVSVAAAGVGPLLGVTHGVWP